MLFQRKTHVPDRWGGQRPLSDDERLFQECKFWLLHAAVVVCVLPVVFALLKLADVVTWSWVTVLSPVWGAMFVVFALTYVTLMWCAVVSLWAAAFPSRLRV